MYEQIDMMTLLKGDTLLAAIAKTGSGFANGKERIKNEWNTKKDMPSFINFLKKEYGIGGMSFEYENRRGFIDHNGKGIRFKEWHSDKADVFTYKQLAEEIIRLIYDGLY